MTKIMLVIDNVAEREFLEKVLRRLEYEVIALTKGSALAEQLLDHFPDVVFASTLGTNQKILTALAKIKEARGKPKVVFVRQEQESSPLNADQKKVIDGVIYSPIDPFKLTELLALVTPKDQEELRALFNEMQKSHSVTAHPVEDESKIIKTGEHAHKKRESTLLSIDPKRKKKYQDICDQLKSERTGEPPTFNVKKLKDLREKQSGDIREDPEVKENRKHFLKTIFGMDPKEKT